MLGKNRTSLSVIRSEIDRFLQVSASTDDVFSLKSDLLSQFSDVNSTSKGELYAWIPRTTLLCPSELNTSADLSCSSNDNICGTSLCPPLPDKRREENDLEEDQEEGAPSPRL